MSLKKLRKSSKTLAQKLKLNNFQFFARRAGGSRPSAFLRFVDLAALHMLGVDVIATEIKGKVFA
ncbi:hypothetical protein GKR41_00049 [Candidatus Vallotia lariciata]|nr:hypothetical protein GKR41_00049 [Candidatus Vallotia lariciata]